MKNGGKLPVQSSSADQAQAGAEQILAHCESRLARYKLPKKFIFVEAIPRNPAGKVLKRVLRDQYAA